MLLLCIGPDTFRAQRKAVELELAFREKYDKAGTSVERLSSGKDGIQEIIEKANTVSLFCPRRFMRGTDVLGSCPKSLHAPLAQALQRDPDNIIVVSIESEPPAESAMKAFANVSKVMKYEFPTLSGSSFLAFVKELAASVGGTDEDAVGQIAEFANGDSWLASNELAKLAAGGQTALRPTESVGSIFDIADAYLRQGSDHLRFLGQSGNDSQLLSTLLNQSRVAVRVKDRALDGLNPYVARKIQGQRIPTPEKNFAQLLQALLAQRAGFAAEEDVFDLLG